MLKVEERARERLALERGLRGELAVDGSDDSVDPDEESGDRVVPVLEDCDSRLAGRRLSLGGLVELGLLLNRLDSTVSDPFGEVIHEVENGLEGCERVKTGVS